MRFPLVVANWKMNKDNKEASDFLIKLKNAVIDFSTLEVVICPSFVALEKAYSILRGTSIKLGAQNIHQEKKGAYTGEVAAFMIAPFCSYVILGHSERRKYFQETYPLIRQKINTALEYNLQPIICVGEDLNERNNGLTVSVVKSQIEEALRGLEREKAAKVAIAYEPIWAIGTGISDEPEESNLVSKEIRDSLAHLFDSELASNLRILYGGSVNPENVANFIKMPQIDGALVGGASLNIESFLSIIKIIQQNYSNG